MTCFDWIHIRDLNLQCIVGVHDFEKLAPREITIQISLNTPLHRAGSSDLLIDTVNYATIRDAVAEFVTASHFELIESLAEGIAALCLKNKKVIAVRVEVEKPGALLNARSVSVEITRGQP